MYTWPAASTALAGPVCFNQMHEGTIKNVVLEKGFGFVAERGGPDRFFHVNDLIDLEFDHRLIERRVKFDAVDAPKGPRAKCVQPAE